MPSRIGNCPTCNAFRSVELNHHTLSCTACSFELDVLCPYCSVGQLQKNNQGSVCCHCHRPVSPETLAYILTNRLLVNTHDRCEYCDSPTLGKATANISARCFDHPVCGNQTSLFGAPTRDKDYVFLDFETTGLQIGNESIIELGACRVNKDGQESFFQELIRPVTDIKPLITNITGIDNDMVRHAPLLKDVMHEFLAFSDGACLVAHNAQFDIPWLITTLLRHQLNIPYTDLLCTLKWAKTREDGKRSLGALSKKYNIGHENAHRALADAVVTKCLFFIYDQDSPEKPFEPMDRYIDLSKKLLAQYPNFCQP
jgi:DNA polymerase III epsilon subunit family exonuclease